MNCVQKKDAKMSTIHLSKGCEVFVCLHGFFPLQVLDHESYTSQLEKGNNSGFFNIKIIF